MLIRKIIGWSRQMSEKHGVNPWIFGLLYFGTIPTYVYGIARFVASYKAGWGESIFWFLVGFVSFLAPYLYIMVWGHNLSRRFYSLVCGWMTIAAIVAIIKVIRQL